MKDPRKKQIIVDELLKPIIPFFIHETVKDLEKLKRALEIEDSDAIKRLAHTLKGECGSYGFSELGSLARSIESAVMKNDLSTARQIFLEMQVSLSLTEVSYKAGV